MRNSQIPCRVIRSNRCRPGPECLSSYDEVVDAYIRDHRAGAQLERQFFKGCESLEVAIEFAALCKLPDAKRPDGKRHPHHYRRSRAALAEAESVLQACAAEMRDCETFDELYRLIQREIFPIAGIGELVVYDVSTWIGAYLDLAPVTVYLHAGAGDGAIALGFDKRGTLGRKDLPRAFRRLRACEIEDCLCIYKNELANIDRNLRRDREESATRGVRKAGR